MATAYDVAFKYEILNEFIASVDGLIGRSFPQKLPADIAKLSDEVWDMYRKIPFEDDVEVLDQYDRRLTEIRDYVKDRADKPQKSQKRMVG